MWFEFVVIRLKVTENSPAGSLVGSVVATDADSVPFNHIVYRLSSDANGLFDVDPISGHIVTTSQLDREQVIN